MLGSAKRLLRQPRAATFLARPVPSGGNASLITAKALRITKEANGLPSVPTLGRVVVFWREREVETGNSHRRDAQILP
jgi:hypothetical protein